jgi:hypothetical protein
VAGVASTAPNARRAQHGDGEHDDVVEAMGQQQLPPPYTYQLSAPAILSNGNDDKPDEFAADPAGYYCRSTLASRV